MPLNKTALKKMKKDELVEHILKIQKENETTALFSSDEQEENHELKKKIQELKDEYKKLIREKEGWRDLTFKLRDAGRQLQEENKKLKKENEELASIIKKMDTRMIDLRRIKNDITQHPDYERLISIEENQ